MEATTLIPPPALPESRLGESAYVLVTDKFGDEWPGWYQHRLGGGWRSKGGCPFGVNSPGYITSWRPDDL